MQICAEIMLQAKDFFLSTSREAYTDSEGGLILLITLHSASGESMCGTKTVILQHLKAIFFFKNYLVLD